MILRIGLDFSESKNQWGPESMGPVSLLSHLDIFHRTQAYPLSLKGEGVVKSDLPLESDVSWLACHGATPITRTFAVITIELCGTAMRPVLIDICNQKEWSIRVVDSTDQRRVSINN